MFGSHDASFSKFREKSTNDGTMVLVSKPIVYTLICIVVAKHGAIALYPMLPLEQEQVQQLSNHNATSISDQFERA